MPSGPEARRIRIAARAAAGEVCKDCGERPIQRTDGRCHRCKQRRRPLPTITCPECSGPMSPRSAVTPCVECRKKATRRRRQAMLRGELRCCPACGGWHAARGSVLCNRCRSRGTREVALDLYGGACACCGETTPGFLTFVHAPDGAERDSQGRWVTAQMAVEHAGDGHCALVCCNCKYGSATNGGVCPHKTKGECPGGS